MKKNVMMRVASVLLIAVLMSTCVISGTFAKYTTSATGRDTARVAKWGVEIVASGATFAESYDATAETKTVISVAANDENSKANVIAPGTSGSMAALAVTGTPEVAVNVSYSATLTLTGWDVGTQEAPDVYCPIQITVGTTTYKIGSGTAPDNTTYVTDVADLKTKVEAAIAAISTSYPANTDLSAVNDDLVVSWAWTYDGNDDVKDTKLGNLSTAPTITLEVTATITQAD